MKNFYAICITLILMLNLSFAKDFWEKVNIPNDNYVFDISFMSNGNILSAGNGTHKSTDSGNSWNDISKFIYQGKEISLSAVPVKIDSIFPVNDTLFFASFLEGFIVRSTNAGLSWTPMDSKIQNARTFVKAANNRIFTNRYDRLYYTDDLGLTWLLYQGWSLVESGNTKKTRMSVSPEGKIFVSNNGVWVIDPVTLVGTKYTTGIDSTYIRCFAFSKGKVYAGTDTSGIFVSTDNGQSWANLPGSPKDVPISVLAVSPSGKIFAGSEGKMLADRTVKCGLFYSTDEGANWQEITDTDFSERKIYDIEYHNDILYIASAGLYISEDDGINWQSMPANPGYPIATLFDSYNGNNFKAITMNNMYKSEQSLNNWIKIDSEINYDNIYATCLTDEGKFITSTLKGEFLISDDEGITSTAIPIDFESINVIGIKKARNGFIYILNYDHKYGNQIYYSKDNGYKWDRIESQDMFIYYTIGSGDELLAIDNYMKVSFSSDLGINWTSKICPLLITTKLGDIHCADISDDYIYIGTYKTGIIKSSDGGDTWSYMNDGLNSGMKTSDNINIEYLKIIGNIVYASTEFGLFSSELNSNTWKLEESGMTVSHSLFINLLSDNHIYVSTLTGLYRSVDAVTSVENDKNLTYDNSFNIAPNPASDFITITLSNKGLKPFVTTEKVQIFDMLGIEVVFVGIGLDLSTHKIDISHLPAGVYFIRIGNRVEKFVKN